MEGTVVWFSKEKNIGLIRNEQGDLLVVHPAQVISKKKVFELKVGEKLKFSFAHLTWKMEGFEFVETK